MPLFQMGVARARNRILHLAERLPPCSIPPRGPIEIHVPVCQRDWLPAVWSVFSIHCFLKKKLPVIFHDDGSMTKESALKLAAQFPGASFRGRKENDEMAELKLARYPFCRAYRVSSPAAFGRKFFDPMLVAKSESVLCLDSDILCLSEPVELIKAGEEPDVDMIHHCERQDSYIKCTELVERFPGMTTNLNGGLTLRKTRWLTLEFLEEATHWLAENHMRIGLPRSGSDQVLLSVVASQGKIVELPDVYSNNPMAFRQQKDRLVTMHFHSWSRYLLEMEGIPEFLSKQTI
jgi:hypothetical protein